MKSIFMWTAAIAAAALVIGCGGSDDTTITGQSPRVRAINAIYGPDSVFVRFSESNADNQPLTFGAKTNYAITDNTFQNVYFSDTTSGAIYAQQADTLFRNNNYYTVIGVGGLAEQKEAFFIQDRTDDPSNGDIRFRVVNAVNSTGITGMNVYLVETGGSIDGRIANYSNVGFTKTATDYQTTQGGVFDVVVTDSTSGRVLSRTPLTLTANETWTIVVFLAGTDPGNENVMVQAYLEGED